MKQENSRHPETIVPLDDYYYLKLQAADEQGRYTGEVVRSNGSKKDDQATHLFDVPIQPNAEAAELWAVNALRAYREG